MQVDRWQRCRCRLLLTSYREQVQLPSFPSFIVFWDQTPSRMDTAAKLLTTARGALIRPRARRGSPVDNATPYSFVVGGMSTDRGLQRELPSTHRETGEKRDAQDSGGPS
jgi:hypothetical protein